MSLFNKLVKKYIKRSELYLTEFTYDQRGQSIDVRGGVSNLVCKVVSKRDEELRPLRERHVEWQGDAPIQDRIRQAGNYIRHNHKNHRNSAGLL